jgi:hypothetical protein
MPFQPWQRPASTALALHAVARQLSQLTGMHGEEKNRPSAAGPSSGPERGSATGDRRTHEYAIERLTQRAHSLIGEDPQLAERFQLLGSLPGIGEAGAARLLGELAVLAPTWTFARRGPATDWVPTSTSR